MVQAVASWDGDLLTSHDNVVRRRKEHVEDLVEPEDMPSQVKAGLTVTEAKP